MLYTEFVAAAHSESKRLMVVLHGLGDSIAGYRDLVPAFHLPWLNYLLVNAPDSYYGGFSWYDFTGDEAKGIRRSREMLFKLLDAKRAEGFPSEQTILFGFSQGCLMTVDVGFRYPHRLAGMVGVSGYVHEPNQLIAEMSPVAKQQQMLFTHGTQDPLIPSAEVRKQVQLLQSAGLQIEWRDFVKGHTIAGEQELAVIRRFVESRFAS